MGARLTFAIVVGAVAASAAAQTTTIECDYPRYSDGQSVKHSNEKFRLTFLIDKKKGSAYMIANAGSAEVNVVPSNNGLTFIEVTDAGNVMTTVLDNYGTSTHSRGTRVQGRLVPSQYYGTCKSK